MSYFPTGDVPTPPLSHTPNFSSFESTPTNPRQQEWTECKPVNEYGFSTPQQQSPYIMDTARGLGLFSLPASSVQAYLEMDMNHDPRPSSRMPSTWPSQFAVAQAALTYPPPFRPAYWTDDSHHPSSTVMAQNVWNPPPLPTPRAALYESPALSHYSPESYHSVASTPYARSDSVLRPAASPMIKVEPTPQRSIPDIRFIPESTSHSTDSQLVKPEDLFTNPTTPPHSHSTRETSYNLSPSPAASEYKPLAVRPSRPRAFSSADILEDRKKRGYTSSDKATCACEQCGKLFQRTYNLRAHMETHDPFRMQPHLCSYDFCGKRFVRRTDLIRHEQSVHLKERNHICPLCHSAFSRKDTLRRHIDDGCLKRSEVKKRSPQARRASSASQVKISPRGVVKREQSPMQSWAWEAMPEFA